MKYMERVGAVCDGGGTWYVNEGYKRLLITVEEDGSLKADPSLPPPTPDELKQVKDNAEALRKVVAPVAPVPVSVKIPNLPGTIYEYRDHLNRLLMFVQRVDNEQRFDEEGKREKNCFPWVYDGVQWQQQGWPKELRAPLYGNWQNRTRIMIHEGEKACQAAIDASRAESQHPWRDWLARFGHATWPGGSSRVFLADWSSLPKKSSIWIMPDNDGPGYDAAYSIIRNLGDVRSVRLYHHRGNNAPRSWDLADIPFTTNYNEVSNGFVLAERAVDLVFGDDGKPHYELRKEFVQKFAYAKETGEFVELRRPMWPMNLTNFSHAYAHLAPQIRNLGDLMLRSPHLTMRDSIGYRPFIYIDENDRCVWTSHESDEDRERDYQRLFKDDSGKLFVNMYRPPLVIEEKPKGLSDLKPFLTYMRHLIPGVRERKILLRWSACVLAGKRLRWAPLLISQKQGTGKSTFARILRTLVGPHNSAQVTSAALQDKFTSWAMNKQLVVVPELNEGSSFKLAEHLKTFIDGDEIPIRRMNVDQYDSESYLSFVFSSNHMSAISIAKNDRRWYLPRVTEHNNPWVEMEDRKFLVLCERYLGVSKSVKGNAFFVALWEWMDHKGAEWLLYLGRRYGLRLDETGWRSENDKAPDTDTKSLVEERSKSSWMERLDEVLSDTEVAFENDLREYLRDNNEKYVPKTQELVDYCEEQGLHPQFMNPSSKSSQARRGVISVMQRPGLRLKTVVVSREMLDETWSKHKGKETIFSNRFKGAFGEEAM